MRTPTSVNLQVQTLTWSHQYVLMNLVNLQVQTRPVHSGSRINLYFLVHLLENLLPISMHRWGLLAMR